MTTVIEFYISDKERKSVIKKLSDHFETKICKLIEKGIYDFTKQTCEDENTYLKMSESIYKDCFANILFNLENNKTTINKIKQSIKAGKYNAYNLAFCRPDELDKDNWMKIIARKALTEDTLKNLSTTNWKPCYTCKNTAYFFYQLQTRSADEPMTTFYICKNCNKTYKVNN
ncbi:TFII-like transcription factor [Cotonvirus japonicus]|uniref:TFII-like transcription factor n=1 Tax=Cotonvirus japonicus TaxID=2811091 RepID=A0ABM7NT13_9VIRU|nr:TFII-like transcription factor [Cotonvirus japonicus]BCS83241.1 TFII-like transcription factor [Cotonvirus japonicus]